MNATVLVINPDNGLGQGEAMFYVGFKDSKKPCVGRFCLKTGLRFERNIARITLGVTCLANVHPVGQDKYKLTHLDPGPPDSKTTFELKPVPPSVHEKAIEVAKMRSQTRPPNNPPQRNKSKDFSVGTERRPHGPPSGSDGSGSRGFSGRNGRNGPDAFEARGTAKAAGSEQPLRRPQNVPKGRTDAEAEAKTGQREGSWQKDDAAKQEVAQPEKEVCRFPVIKEDEASHVPRTLKYVTQEAAEVAPVGPPEELEVQPEQAPSEAVVPGSPSTLYGTQAEVTDVNHDLIKFNYGHDKPAILKPGDTVNVLLDDVMNNMPFEKMVDIFKTGQKVEADIKLLDGEAKMARIAVRRQYAAVMPEIRPEIVAAAKPSFSGDDGAASAGGCGQMEPKHEEPLEAEVQVVPTCDDVIPDEVVLSDGNKTATLMEESAGEASDFHPMAADISYYQEDHTVPAGEVDTATITTDSNANLYDDKITKPTDDTAVKPPDDFTARVESHSRALSKAVEEAAATTVQPLEVIHEEVIEEVVKFEEDTTIVPAAAQALVNEHAAYLAEQEQRELAKENTIDQEANQITEEASGLEATEEPAAANAEIDWDGNNRWVIGFTLDKVLGATMLEKIDKDAVVQQILDQCNAEWNNLQQQNYEYDASAAAPEAQN